MLASLMTQIQLGFLATDTGHSAWFIHHCFSSTWLTVCTQLMFIILGNLKIISEMDILALYDNFGATHHISSIQEAYIGFLLMPDIVLTIKGTKIRLCPTFRELTAYLIY